MLDQWGRPRQPGENAQFRPAGTRALCRAALTALLVLSALALRADDAPIAIIPQDGFNLQVVYQSNSHYVVTTLDPPVFNFFAGAFADLPTEQEVTIGLNMTGMDAEGNESTVSKWRGLRAQLSYAADRYESFEYFTRQPDGTWLSGDPLKTGTARLAGDGPLPAQTAVPAELARYGLSPDGRYWQAWHDLDRVDVLPDLNILRMHHTFHAPRATLAMRVPYTPAYHQALLERLQTAALPGVFVDDLGFTPDGRPLQIIRLEDPAQPAPPATQPTLLLYGSEHHTEMASSFGIVGALGALLADTPDARALRRGRTWLLLPLLDPDGHAAVQFARLTDRFVYTWPDPTPPEILAYARYFTAYVAAGRSLDLAVALHNVEATECPPIFNPFWHLAFPAETQQFNRALFARLQAAGYRLGNPDAHWNIGALAFRLNGWLTDRFGAFPLAYELNDRYPAQPLSLAQLQGLGAHLAAELAAWTAGQQHHQHLQARLAGHRAARAEYFAPPTSDGDVPYVLLTLGFSVGEDEE